MEWLVWMGAVAILGLAAVAASGRLGEFPATVTDTPQPHVPSGTLAGSDLRALRFAVVPRGYSMQQVDELLDRISHQLDQSATAEPSVAEESEAGEPWDPPARRWTDTDHSAEVEPQPPLSDESEVPPGRGEEPPVAPTWRATEVVVAAAEAEPSNAAEDEPAAVASSAELLSEPGSEAAPEVATEGEPVAEAADMPEPSAESGIESEPVLEAEPIDGPELVAEPVSDDTPRVEAEPEVVAEGDSQAAAEVEPVAADEPQVAAEAEPVAEGDPQAAAEAEPAAVVEPPVAVDVEPIAEPESVGEPVAAAKAKSDSRSRREPKAKPKSEPIPADPAAPVDELEDEIARIGTGQAVVAEYGAALDDLVSKYSFRKVEHWYELPGFDIPAPTDRMPTPPAETEEPEQDSTSGDI